MVLKTQEAITLKELLEFGYVLKPNVNDRFRNLFLRDKPMVTLLGLEFYDRTIDYKCFIQDLAIIKLDNGMITTSTFSSLEQIVKKTTKITLIKQKKI